MNAFIIRAERIVKSVCRFCKKNSAPICLVLGSLASVTAYVVAVLGIQKDTYRALVHANSAEEEAAVRKKGIIRQAICGTVFLVGLGLTVASFFIQHRIIGSLSKALAASVNALPMAAAATCAPMAAAEGTETTDSVKIAASMFSIPVDDLGFHCYNAGKDDVGKVTDFEDNIDRIRMLGGAKDLPVTFNDVLRATSRHPKLEPYGWTIGWKRGEDIQAVLVLPDGSIPSTEEAVQHILTNGTEEMYYLFTNMTDLSGGIKYDLQEVIS